MELKVYDNVSETINNKSETNDANKSKQEGI